MRNMSFPLQILDDLIAAFSSFPGIGKRTATRMVLHLLKQKSENMQEMGRLISTLPEKIRYCKQCHNITDAELCSICQDTGRSSRSICVVEDLKDLISIENTSQYHGKYHVLGGVISPVDGIGPEQLHIDDLIERIQKEGTEELIFALNTTIEGDTTLFYISRQLESLPVKISVISRGVSIGGELEYTDEITLGRSIINRIPYKA
jgi:recombination protein RecR